MPRPRIHYRHYGQEKSWRMWQRRKTLWYVYILSFHLNVYFVGKGVKWQDVLTLSVVIFFIVHLRSFSTGSKQNSPRASRMRPWGEAFLWDVGLNYKGWRSQTSTQSPAALMINLRPIQRVHIPSKWENIFAGSSVFSSQVELPRWQLCIETLCLFHVIAKEHQTPSSFLGIEFLKTD